MGIAALPFCNLRLQSEKPKGKAYPKQVATIGDAIRKRRLDLGLRQRELATRLGCNEMSIVNWELGYRTPQIAHLRQIVEFLGYNPFPNGSDRAPPKGSSISGNPEVSVSEYGRYERGERIPMGKYKSHIT